MMIYICECVHMGSVLEMRVNKWVDPYKKNLSVYALAFFRLLSLFAHV